MDFSGNKKKTLPIKHNHPHTNIFVEPIKAQKCRFKKGNKIYFIKEKSLSIDTANVLDIEFLDYLKIWRISSDKGYFIDKSKDSSPNKVIKHNLDVKAKYPYKKKINALNRLRRQIKDKLWQIEKEMDEVGR